MNLEKRMLALTSFWYEYVGCDHHKDKDCHFYINKKWSYGQPAVYEIHHNGYIAELATEEYETHEEALSSLVDWLDEEITRVYRNFPEDWQDERKWDYNFKGVMKICKKHDLYKTNVE